MFGRRTTSDVTPAPRAISAAKDGAMPAKTAEAKPVLVEASRAAPKQEPATPERRHSEEYYDVKTTVFNALIDTIDLTQLAKLEAAAARERSATSSARSSRSRMS